MLSLSLFNLLSLIHDWVDSIVWEWSVVSVKQQTWSLLFLQLCLLEVWTTASLSWKAEREGERGREGERRGGREEGDREREGESPAINASF